MGQVGLGSAGDGAGEIRHVLFCVADQWRADALGVVGASGVHTPNLDALAADGVVFANHWCQASPCGPSRQTMLTGTGLATHGQWTNADAGSPSLATLGRTVRAGGVTPTLVGYTDTPHPGTDVSALSPGLWRRLVDPSFEVAMSFVWQHGFPTWRRALEERGAEPARFSDHPFGLYAPDGEPGDDGLAPAWYEAEDSDVALLTDAAIDRLGRWSGGGRQLLHVNWLRPHPPMTAPRPFHRFVDPDAVDPPRRRLPLEDQVSQHPYFGLAVPGRSMTEYLQRRCRLEEVTEADDRHLRAAYLGLVAEVDHHLGRLVEALKAAGWWESTLVVVTSDHGDALGDQWLYGRQGPFDGHFSVPCIIRDPRARADATRGTVVEEPTVAADLFPTICDGLDLDVPSTAEGRSLLPLLEGGPGRADLDWRTHVTYGMSFADHLRRDRRVAGTGAGDHRFVALRTDRYRLVRFPTLPPLLYDLDDDPDETIDRARDPTLRSTLADLQDLAPSPWPTSA